MFLSRAELDPTRRSTMIALTSPQKFHGAVENSFSGERRRRLWRLDSLNGKLYLLLLANMLLFFHADARAEALLTALFLTPLFLAGRWRMGLRLTACYAVLLGWGLWSDAATLDTAGLRAPRQPPALTPTPRYMSSGCFPWGFA